MQPLAQLPSIRYPYCDHDGTLLFTVVRHYPKRFQLLDPQDIVLPDGAFPSHVLYRLPELLAADPGETVWYVEGEKDVESLRDAGLIATTNPGGSHHGWKDHYADDLHGRHVVIVPDADGPGKRLAAAVAAGLRGAAASVVTLHLPIHGRDDVSDWLARHGNIPRLLELAAKARFEAAGIHGKLDRRGLILASRLSTLEKLMLLAMLHMSTHDGAAKVDRCRTTAGSLAARCSCHRVTAQQKLMELLRAGVLRRKEKDWVFVWDVLAMLTIPPRRAVLLA
jgi:hypothetical protein